MLTADLVRARVVGDRLVLQQLEGKRRGRATELAAALLAVARDRLGASRDEVREAWGGCGAVASERKLLLGLAKLIEDASTFAEPRGEGSIELRRAVFLRAAAHRRAGADAAPRPGTFDRSAVLAEIAAERGTTEDELEAELFADLRGAQPLLTVPGESAEALVERYEHAQVQAVLLRAVRLVADLDCPPTVARTLFHRLKFHRLLHRIELRDPNGYRLVIDGPYSVLGAVTKYGLELALMVPALRAADRAEIEAEVRWGTRARPVTFRHSLSGNRAHAGAAPSLNPEAQGLLEAFASLDTPWRAAAAGTVLELPGVGLVVPDLAFSHPDLEAPIFLEVLGYWSRAAVWRRVELVEAGFPHRLLFAVSSRLRVSEEVLDGSESAALYVFKGTLSARAVERKLDQLRRR
jgi:predicted nuclease of restriction endonuclease-like RecB superfamily